jgi:hypothetical protein
MAKMYLDPPVNSDEEFDVVSTQDESQTMSDCVYDEEYYCDMVVVRVSMPRYSIYLRVLTSNTVVG